MSGTDALRIAKQMFRSNSGKELEKANGYTGMLGRIGDSLGDVDEAIAFVYRAPRSYTGEDVVEFSCHGGYALLERVLQLCVENGAKPANPGEFTKRAFLNGKMSLSQAEAVMDLIHAQGESAVRAAMAAKDGALNRAIEAIAGKLMDVYAGMAAWVDYPEEEMQAVEGAALTTALQRVQTDMQLLLRSWDRGKVVREGITTVIVGRPNVGKSTLMNLLAGEERSIVTEIPGTTRDVVEDSVRIGSFILRLADTAGMRESEDAVERIGVERAKERMQRADLVLAVFDSSDHLCAEDVALLEQLAGRPCVAVVNKIDLPQKLDCAMIQRYLPRMVMISAGQGLGRDRLEQEIKTVLELDAFDPTAAMITTQRQKECLLQALGAVGEALEIMESAPLLDVVGVLLEDALDALLSLSGKRAGEAVVDEVFARFCVGK